jgi:hypothetical protein
MNPLTPTSEHSPKLALTREETAKALGIGASTLDKLAARDLIRPSRALRRPLYSLQEIERFLRDTAAHLRAGS